MLSSTTLHEGDTITISGTGCVDPADGGDVLEVVLLLPIDMGRGGTAAIRPTIHAEAEPDGTFEGSGVIGQPMFPDGAQTGIFSCQVKSDDGYPPVFAQREVALTIVPPSLPDLTVQAGTSFEYTLPCSIEGGGYGFFAIIPEGPNQASLSVSGSFPYDTSPKKGDKVTIEVAADAPPGTYDATASCGVSEGGTSAYYAGFKLTFTPASDPGPTTTTPVVPNPPGSAAPAQPVEGTATFTG